MTDHSSPDIVERLRAKRLSAYQSLRNDAADEIERLRNVAQSAWQPIETAPHETRVLLGWVYDGSWFCETGMASHGWRRGAYSTMSQHGQATQWMPLPDGPALISAERGCICQEQHRRGYCTEPGCPHAQQHRQD